MSLKTMLRSLALCGFAAFLPLLITAPPALGQESAEGEVLDATAASLFSSMKVSGSVHSSYSFWNYDGRDDHDIFTFFSLRLDDIVKDRIDAAFSLYWREDLDSTSLRSFENYDPFLELNDVDKTDFRFYTAYVDVKELGFEGSYLRLGRQFFEDIDFVHFDGLSYHFSPIDRLDVSLFGGRPVSFFASNDGEAIYGTHLQYRFSDQTRGAATYYRYDGKDNQPGGPFSYTWGSKNDDYTEIEFWHRFTPYLQGHIEFSLLDAQPYILQNDYLLYLENLDLDLNFQIIRLFERVGQHTINFNPYFPLMYDFEPFTYGSFFAVKGINEYLSLTGGVDVRQTDSINSTQKAFTNRDFVRGMVGVEVYPTKKLTLELNGEFWAVDPNDEFTGISGEIEYKHSKQWTFIAGAHYGEYVQEYLDEFLFFFGETRVLRISPDVMTYYSRVKWQPTSRMFTSASIEFEDNSYDEDDWFGFRLQMGVNF